MVSKQAHVQNAFNPADVACVSFSFSSVSCMLGYANVLGRQHSRDMARFGEGLRRTARASPELVLIPVIEGIAARQV